MATGVTAIDQRPNQTEADDRARSGNGARRRWFGGTLLLLIVGVPALVPIFYVIAASFSDSHLGEPWSFSLEPWSRVFESPKTLSSMVNSFILTVRIPIGIVVAVWFAWVIVRVDIPGRRVIMYCLWFTFFLPILPLTVGWILLAHEDYGLINQLLENLPFISGPVFNIESIPGILWVHLTLATIPIMTLLLAPALRQLDGAYEEASDMAGARVGTTVRRITALLILPTILVAFVAGLIRALEVFEVERLLGAPAGILVYSTRIYDLLREIPPDYPQAMALSTLFLVILVGVGIFYQMGIKRSERNATITGKGGSFVPRTRTWRAWAISIFLFVGLAFTVGLPFVVLVLGSFSRLFGFFFLENPWTLAHWAEVLTSSSFLSATRNTLIIATVVALVGTLIYAVVATILARSRLWSRGAVSLLVWLPWAIPGVLLGTAFLNLFLNTPGLTGLPADADSADHRPDHRQPSARHAHDPIGSRADLPRAGGSLGDVGGQHAHHLPQGHAPPCGSDHAQRVDPGLHGGGEGHQLHGAPRHTGNQHPVPPHVLLRHQRSVGVRCRDGCAGRPAGTGHHHARLPHRNSLQHRRLTGDNRDNAHRREGSRAGGHRRRPGRRHHGGDPRGAEPDEDVRRRFEGRRAR